MTELAERLGFAADDRVVIVSCRDLGASHACTSGVYDALRRGAATTASLMVPAPWAREAASQYRGEDVGVQITLNSEHDRYRWGPTTRAPSLLDGDGGFPRTLEDLWDHADLDETRREIRAQVERAILWGFDVSHLSSHLAALQRRPEFFDVYLDVALEYSLPIRLASADLEKAVGFPFRALASDEGVIAPDHLVTMATGAARQTIHEALSALPTGITQIDLSPALDTPELQAYDDAWTDRVDDHRFLTDGDGGLTAALDAAGVHRIGFRQLRELQQST